MIKLHKEGRQIILITVVILSGINIAAILFLSNLLIYPISILSIAMLILTLRFFRVPDRKPLRDERTIVAPADGKVVVIEEVHMDEYLDRQCMQVSIFMSIHDVHINYFPASGMVEYQKYHPGAYLLARHPKSSSLNERYSVGIKTTNGRILVRQIAGYVARRIRCYARVESVVEQGDELGFIKFGSRLDIFFPLNARIEVSLNQMVTGSVTPIARIS